MTHQIICCSDTHGESPPAGGVFEDPTALAILHAGDFYEGPSLVGRGDEDEPPLPGDPIADVFLSWSRTRRPPVYGVHGNHDVADPYGWIASVNMIDGRVVRLAEDLLLAGVGWHGEVYFELPRESDFQPVCERVRRELARLATPRDSVILLTHYPPRFDGLFPPRKGRTATAADGGSESIARLVDELKPLAIVQGHEHRWAGLSGRANGGRGPLILNPHAAGMVVQVDTGSRVARLA